MTTSRAPSHASATCAGVAIRVQGMRRRYALLRRDAEARLVKVVGSETLLASCPSDREFGQDYVLSLSAAGGQAARVAVSEIAHPGAPRGPAMGYALNTGSGTAPMPLQIPGNSARTGNAPVWPSKLQFDQGCTRTPGP